jgi:hypothetical protein
MQLLSITVHPHIFSTDWHPKTDSYPNGYFWDMYSNNKTTSWSGLNREHNMPKSWFGIASGEENSEPIGTDYIIYTLRNATQTVLNRTMRLALWVQILPLPMEL